LQVANAEYRKLYPGLIYLTFVNGRSREAIADEMEAFLSKSPSLLITSLPKLASGEMLIIRQLRGETTVQRGMEIRM
jgi:hypothetical protein